MIYYNMSLINYIKKLYKEKEEKKYDTIYIMVDIHNTILKPTFNKKEKFEYFPYAKETLQILSNRNDVKLIMWSSCYSDRLDLYLNHFRENGIKFNFINCNPEYKNLSFACFDTKFYYDVGIDDKFGFDAENDWETLFLFFTEIYE